jgi:Bacterial HORMA domain family 1
VTFTQTRTGTLTTTLARVKYVTRKVQADLLAILDTYGYYSEEYALKVIRDLRVLLDEEVIWRVDFVWSKKGTNSVIDSLSYTVVCGDALPDDDTGDILYDPALSDSAASFFLVIYWSQRWRDMREPSKDRVRERLELGWENDVDFNYGYGWWVKDRTYSKGGYGLERQRFQKVG